MIDSDFLNALARFNIIIRKRVTSNFAGARKSIAQGRGMIYKDHRPYVAGDDIRAIDWKVFARTDSYMIKNYEEERNLTVHILVDASASMNYGKKFDYASMIGVGHAYLSMKSNDKFQFSTFGTDFDMYQPKRGMSQVMAMIDYLNKIKPKGQTDFKTIGDKYRKMIGSRSLVIVVSDFLAPIDDIKHFLGSFGSHELSIIHVVDKKEEGFSWEGDLRLQDSESNDKMRTYFSLRSKQNYEKRLHDHHAAIEHECTSKGIDFASVSTSKPIFEAFYSVFTRQ